MKKDDSSFFNRLFIKETTDTKLQFFRYLFVGGTAAVVNIGALYIFTEFLHFHVITSNVLGFILGLLTNYILSRILVFAKEKSSNKIFEFGIFAIIGVIGLGFDTLFMWLFTYVLGLYYMLSKIVSTGLVFIWNFVGRKTTYMFLKNRKEDK